MINTIIICSTIILVSVAAIIAYNMYNNYKLDAKYQEADIKEKFYVDDKIYKDRLRLIKERYEILDSIEIINAISNSNLDENDKTELITFIKVIYTITKSIY